MRKTTINFNIDLDAENVPEKIRWEASDKPEASSSETKAISVALWEPGDRNTLRIDLWTKDMPVDEMKRFYVDCLGGWAQTILNATGDAFMSSETQELCNRLVEHLKKEKT